jgi:membrane-associated phospholipid phosphatase
VLAAQTCTLLLKVAVNRTRPSGPSSRIGSSFPSGHTTTAIALATVIEKHAGWKAGVPAYAVASLVAASRVRYNQHYLSDVVAGATVALIAGRSAVRMNGKPLPASKKGRRTTVSISPLGGSGLRVAVEF